MIQLIDVSKYYPCHSKAIVEKINFTVKAGHTLALIGSSGCGKTTLLKLINRLIPASSGEILLDGINIKKIDIIHLRRKIGYVIQQVGLFPHLTVAENISITLKLDGKSQKIQQETAEKLLTLVNLTPAQFADRYPHQLSGGQQQRVGVARALATDPPILLFDEPFGALDKITRDELQHEILTLQRQLKKTLIIVTHDIQEALRLGDEIAVMDQGTIQQIATPQNLCAAPANAFVATLLDKANIFLSSP